ncbi:hypothetical protein POM88_015411 [Heracleum sosnowskyi]|uniref:Nucleolar protein 58/56 N-terminal domain-containing protein n=1 Tax=Heracleum sosnowskyi TaxID=360622 RepID=A0AAD8ILB9_9APIA|nr:hypothetical protein POM88_015411 [Heracleum sosnowskyi]
MCVLNFKIAILNNAPSQLPTFDSQGFQILRVPQSVSESQRSIVRDALSKFQHGQPAWVGHTAYSLFEFACGYALFEAHGVNELQLSNYSRPLSLLFKSHEEFIKQPHQVFTLKAFHPFSSTADALVQMNAISNSTLSQHLKIFLADNLPNPLDGETRYYVSTLDPFLGGKISEELRMSTKGGVQNDNLTRSLRMNIENFIDGLVPKDVEKAQLNLARLYSRQMCNKTNLIPGEALYGEEFIFAQNEDGTEVEYRLWNPLRSKLANAIMCGVTNIWVKPGSRILYLGDDACQITISHLSDLVGLDGLVYVVGLSNVAVNMAEKRSNVIVVFEKPSCHWKYRMVVGMVDVIYADIVNPEVYTIINNASFYLRAGGHYMVYTQVNNIYLTSRGKDPFANHHQRKEFTPIEVVTLEPIHRAYAMAFGGFRMLEE